MAILGRDAVEAASAGVALDGHHRQSVADVAADAVVSRQQTLVDLLLDTLALCGVFRHQRSRLGLDALQFGLLGREVGSALYGEVLDLLQLEFLGLHAGGILLQALLGQLDFKLLILDLLGDGVELAVVAHVVLLLLVVADHDFSLVHLALALLGQRVQLLDLGVDVFDAGLHPGHLILEVLNLERQFAFHLVDFVDLAVDLLQLIERHDLLLHRIIDVGRLLLRCHMLSL